MFHGREESVKSTNVARDKPMSTDSSPNLEHAAWQNGAPLPLSHRTRPPRALTPRKVDGTRPSDRRWVSADFSQGPAYKSRPGLFTRQGQLEVPGSAGGSTNVSSREVSKDRQRLRRFLSCLPALKPNFSTPSLLRSLASSQSRLPFLSRQNHLRPLSFTTDFLSFLPRNPSTPRKPTVRPN